MTSTTLARTVALATTPTPLLDPSDVSALEALATEYADSNIAGTGLTAPLLAELAATHLQDWLSLATSNWTAVEDSTCTGVTTCWLNEHPNALFITVTRDQLRAWAIDDAAYAHGGGLDRA